MESSYSLIGALTTWLSREEGVWLGGWRIYHLTSYCTTRNPIIDTVAAKFLEELALSRCPSRANEHRR